jgi:hypothetical protein
MVPGLNLGERYFQLSRLGRETFVESVARGNLVRERRPRRRPRGTLAGNSSPAETAVSRVAPSLTFGPARRDLEVFPLSKREGTPFVDLITVGRTSDNDVHLDDRSVSRFHAFFRMRHGRWYVCDAGSSNGTRLGTSALPPRNEAEIRSGMNVHFGLLTLTFYVADDLFDVLNSPAL